MFKQAFICYLENLIQKYDKLLGEFYYLQTLEMSMLFNTRKLS